MLYFEVLKGKMIVESKDDRIVMSNCPLCELDLLTDDTSVLQEHFVTAHSVDTGTAKILINLLQRIERLESRLGPDRDTLVN